MAQVSQLGAAHPAMWIAGLSAAGVSRLVAIAGIAFCGLGT